MNFIEFITNITLTLKFTILPTQGCYDELIAWIEDNAVVLIAVAFAISAIEVRVPLRFGKFRRRSQRAHDLMLPFSLLAGQCGHHFLFYFLILFQLLGIVFACCVRTELNRKF